nr:MAG TPA: hypothetical protein [Caudoviricetes sp.]
MNWPGTYSEKKNRRLSLRRFLQICVHPTIDQRVNGCPLCMSLFFQGVILLRRKPHAKLLLGREIFLLGGVVVLFLVSHAVTSFAGR